MDAPVNQSVAEVDAYSAPESSEAVQLASLDALLGLMRQGTPSPLQLIASLGPALTSEDDRTRTRGVMLLAEVVSTAPELFLLPSDVAAAAEFFSAKLADRTCVRGALKGCLALVQRNNTLGDAAAPPLDATAAAVIMKRFQQYILVQAFGQVERMLSFQLMLAASQGYGNELLEANIDFLEGIIVASEGERDPRCLLRMFECVQSIVALYVRVQPQSLEQGAEALFDALTWYFPMSFTPPPVNKYAITRETLVDALEATFTATSHFAPHFIPLALDKLSSTVRQAKLDALSGLAAAAERFDAAAMRPHIPSLWRGLRAELLAAATDAISDANASEIADAAATCLRRCITALGSEGLTAEVLADVCVDDFLACLAAADTDSLPRTAARVGATCRILAAVAGASQAACGAVSRRVLPGVLDAAGNEEAEPERVALRVLALQAADSVVRAALHGVSDTGLSGEPLKAFAPALLAVTAAAAQSPSASAAFSPMGAAMESLPPELLQAQMALLASLAAFPAAQSPLPPEGTAQAVRQLLQQLQGGAEQREDGSDSCSGSVSASDAALNGLRAIAGAGHAELLRQAALPHLLAQLLPPTAGGVADGQHQAAAALAALAALSQSSSELRPAILAALREAVAQALAGIAEEAVDALEQLTALLRTVQEGILAQAPQPFSDADQRPVSHLVNLVISFEAPGPLPPAAATACSAFVAAATRGSGAAANQAAAAMASQRVLRTCGGVQPQLTPAQAPPAGTQATAASMNANSADELQRQAAVPAALIASVQPAVWAAREVVHGGAPVGQLCSALLAGCLVGGQPAAARTLAVAAASIVNKAPAGDALEAALAAALDGVLLPALAGPPAARQAQAAAAAGWLTRGLAMRGHARAGDCLQQLVSLVRQPAGQSGSEQLADAAATALGTLLSEAAPGQVGLDAASHAVGKLLWQQRTFTQASGLLLGALHEGLRTAQPAPLPLLSALVRLVSGTPPKLLRADTPRLLPWLLEALRRLQEDGSSSSGGGGGGGGRGGGGGGSQETLLAAAAAVKTAIQQPTALEAVEEQADRLLPLLASLSGHQAAADARKAALECLATLAAAGLPRATRTAHKPAMLMAARAALDDRKRIVRQAAVRCRAAWTAA